MTIRRLQYTIDYVHILTFKDEYRQAVAPYFAFDNVEYAIENENSIYEEIRLIFRVEKIALFIKKEGITIIFEGDADDLKNQNGVIKIFWDIYEKIKLFKGYTKTTRHVMVTHSVEIREKEKITEMLSAVPYFNLNPFGKLDEFACIYEFKKDEMKFKFHFGNYSSKDIKAHDLMPFKTEYNKDLIDNVGLMLRSEVAKLEKEPSFSKFKSLIAILEKNISSFNLTVNE
jgi:hypothetical protein